MCDGIWAVDSRVYAEERQWTRKNYDKSEEQSTKKSFCSFKIYLDNVVLMYLKKLMKWNLELCNNIHIHQDLYHSRLLRNLMEQLVTNMGKSEFESQPHATK